MDFKTKEMTPIEFGNGLLSSIGEKTLALGGSKAAVITDAFLATTKHMDTLLDSLDNIGVEYAIFDKVLPDPPDYLVDEAAEMIQNEGCDIIITFGGGSSIDTGKVARLKINAGDTDIFEFADSSKPQPTGKMKLINIPTTSGTGAEVTTGSMITNTKNHLKIGISGPGLTPDLALIDPDVTLELPPKLTLYTGLDAFAHGVEGYLSTFANGYSEVFAEKAVRASAKFLKRAVENGSDITARNEMARAAVLAGYSINFCGVICGHSLAHAIGAYFHITHGAACGLTLPWAVEYVADNAESRVRDIIEMLGGDADCPKEKVGETARNLLLDFNKNLGLPVLSEFDGVDPAKFEEMAETVLGDVCCFLTPRTCLPSDFFDIFKKMYALKG